MYAPSPLLPTVTPVPPTPGVTRTCASAREVNPAAATPTAISHFHEVISFLLFVVNMWARQGNAACLPGRSDATTVPDGRAGGAQIEIAGGSGRFGRRLDFGRTVAVGAEPAEELGQAGVQPVAQVGVGGTPPTPVGRRELVERF